jgi:hypothetical protein
MKHIADRLKDPANLEKIIDKLISYGLLPVEYKADALDSVRNWLDRDDLQVLGIPRRECCYQSVITVAQRFVLREWYLEEEIKSWNSCGVSVEEMYAMDDQLSAQYSEDDVRETFLEVGFRLN